jgi:hypothetical protein
MGLAVEPPVLKVNVFEFARVWLAKNVRRWCSFRARREHRPCSPAKRDAASGAGHRFVGPHSGSPESTGQSKSGGYGHSLQTAIHERGTGLRVFPTSKSASLHQRQHPGVMPGCCPFCPVSSRGHASTATAPSPRSLRFPRHSQTMPPRPRAPRRRASYPTA